MYKTFEEKKFKCICRQSRINKKKKERQLIVGKAFGENGIIKRASDHQDLVARMQHLMDSVQNDSVKKIT